LECENTTGTITPIPVKTISQNLSIICMAVELASMLLMAGIVGAGRVCKRKVKHR
jgi:hypothetical protein